MTKNGEIVRTAAEINPIKGYFFNLWEYNQIVKIYVAKNNAALQEIKKPKIKPKKLNKKYIWSLVFWLTTLSILVFIGLLIRSAFTS